MKISPLRDHGLIKIIRFTDASKFYERRSFSRVPKRWNRRTSTEFSNPLPGMTSAATRLASVLRFEFAVYRLVGTDTRLSANRELIRFTLYPPLPPLRIISPRSVHVRSTWKSHRSLFFLLLYVRFGIMVFKKEKVYGSSWR